MLNLIEHMFYWSHQNYLLLFCLVVENNNIFNSNIVYLTFKLLISYVYIFFIFCIADAIASAENVRVAPSLRSQKGTIINL